MKYEYKCIEYEWALIRFKSNDERGKRAVDLANNGIDYHIINKERTKGEDVILAFMFIPIDKDGNSRPLPIYSELASKSQADKLDLWDKKRNGIPDSVSRRDIISTQKIQELRETFLNPYQAAKMGQIDIILHPKDTRITLIKCLESLLNKREPKVARKHGNIPL